MRFVPAFLSICVLAAALPGTALASVSPTASTNSVTTTGATTADVQGTVNPNGLVTTYKIEYDLASSTWCTSGGLSGSPASTTTPQPLGFTDTTDHDVTVGLTGLTTGSNYCVNLVATGGSVDADGGQIAFTAGAPNASTDNAIATGTTTVDVAGSVNPNGQATTYKVEYGPAISTWCTSGGVSGSPANTTTAQPLGFTDETSHEVTVGLTGLTAGQNYCADLVATNGSDTADGGQIPFTAGAPTVYTYFATATGTTTADVSGSVNPAGQTTTYKVSYDLASSTWCTSGGVSGSPASTTPQALGFNDTTNHDVSVGLTGLTTGSDYCVDLIATNGSSSANGGQTTFTAGAPRAYLSMGPGATPNGPTTATVHGFVNPAGQPTTYKIEYDLASSTWCTSGGLSGSPASTTTPQALGFTDTTDHEVTSGLSGLTAGQDYCVDLVATNGSSSSNSGQSAFTAGSPGALTNDVTATGASTADVHGSVIPAGQTTTYVVEYGLGNSEWCQNFGTSGSPAHTTDPQTLGFTDGAYHDVTVGLTGLTAATEYCAGFVATNASGNSAGPAVGVVWFTTQAPATVTTGSATGLTTSGAVLGGTVNPNGQATTYHFEYGTTSGYGSSTTSTSAGSGSSAQSVSAAIGGLSPNTTYHFRLVATSSAGTTNGSDQTFTTLQTPAGTPGPPTLSGVSLAASRFAAKKGTTLQLTLSEPATVTIVISMKVKGHKINGKCKATKKKGKSCTLTVKKATLTFTGVAGANNFKLGLSRLKPGRYSATLSARNATGQQSQVSTFKFTITKPKKRK